MAKFTFAAVLLCLSIGLSMVHADDPVVSYVWNVTYGTISPLGVPQQVIQVNGQYPGPKINCTSNNIIYINVYNNIDEPLLFTWHGFQLRKNSWADGVPGTMCPIAPGTNYTYYFQAKDQIGTYFYFPTVGVQRASGGMGPIVVHSRNKIPIPFDTPAGEYEILIQDWYIKGHKQIKSQLDSGRDIGKPDGILINGKYGKVGDSLEPIATMEANQTYRYRVCNNGMRTSLNFRIQGHPLKIVEVEGSHVVQNMYDSLDIHVGQCVSVLVTANKEAKDYYMVVSSRFFKKPFQSVALIRYANGKGPVSPMLPPPPPETARDSIAWSINQFRSLRWNLTASAARPNPQGSFHYGQINITRTIRVANTRAKVDGKLRFAVNGISHINPETPLKLAEYFGIANKTFQYNLMDDTPKPEYPKVTLAPNVVNMTFRKFIEIVFENREKTVQSWHLDGYSFFAVAIEPGTWSPEKRKNYNLVDAVSRNTIQVYPKSWAAILITIDNVGMWNLRTDMWHRYYLGQQLYLSLQSPVRSLRDEYELDQRNGKQNLCGNVVGLPNPEPYKERE